MPYVHPFLQIEKVIRAPVYGYIGLTPVEVKLVDTKPVQRLRRISQLTTHYVYPGATHTRFTHSLGVMHVAGEVAMHLLLGNLDKKWDKILEKVFEGKERKYSFYSPLHLIKSLREKLNKEEFDKIMGDFDELGRDMQAVRIIGLLHDVGHGPFSHTFEKFHKVLMYDPTFYCSDVREFNHEDYSKGIIAKDPEIRGVLKDEGFDIDKILGLYVNYDYEENKIEDNEKRRLDEWGINAGKIEDLLKEKLFLNLILRDRAYSADIMDYLMTDAYHSGTIEYGFIDTLRLIQNLITSNGKMLLTTKGATALFRFIQAYFAMYENVYFHKFTVGVDWHICYLLSFSHIENKKKKDSDLLENMVNPTCEDLLKLHDYSVIGEIERVVNRFGDDFPNTRVWLNAFLNRKMLKCIYEVPATQEILVKYVNKPSNWEQDIRSKADMPVDFTSAPFVADTKSFTEVPKYLGE